MCFSQAGRQAYLPVGWLLLYRRGSIPNVGGGDDGGRGGGGDGGDDRGGGGGVRMQTTHRGICVCD